MYCSLIRRYNTASWWTFVLGREGPVSGFRTTAVGEWVESGYDGIRAVFHGEPFNARCDQSRRLPRLLRAAPQAGYSPQRNTPAHRPRCTSPSRSNPFAHHSDPSFSCPVSILVPQPANPALSTWAPPAKPRPSPVPPVHARIATSFPRPTLNSRQTSDREPASPVTNQTYVHSLRILEPASIDRYHP